jgi:hypothetical protein
VTNKPFVAAIGLKGGVNFMVITTLRMYVRDGRGVGWIKADFLG